MEGRNLCTWSTVARRSAKQHSVEEAALERIARYTLLRYAGVVEFHNPVGPMGGIQR